MRERGSQGVGVGMVGEGREWGKGSINPRDAMGRLVRGGSEPFPQTSMMDTQKCLGCATDLLCEGEQLRVKFGDMISNFKEK